MKQERDKGEGTKGSMAQRKIREEERKEVSVYGRN